jgi:peptidyl-prolyl cis-trans isomerase D
MFDFVQNNRFAIQVVLGAVALGFVGFGVSNYASVANDPYLAKVEGVKIYRQDLDRALQGQPADAAARQSALDNLIRQELLLVDARHEGLAAGPEGLRNLIRSLPVFQEDGAFSGKRYSEFLAARNISAETFEKQVARDLMIKQQLQPYLDGQLVSKTQVEQMARLLSEARTLKAVLIKPEDFAGQIKFDDAKLKAYFDANRARFRSPQAVKLEYLVLSQDALAQNVKVADDEIAKYVKDHAGDLVKEERRAAHILFAVPKGAKPEDKAKIKAAAEAVLKDARANPGKFAELAKAHSQDPGSAGNGGDLGYFARGTMTKPFDDAVFSLQKGQISSLVESEFGFHIIKLDDIRGGDEMQAKERARSLLQRQKAGELFRSESDKLNDLAYQQANSLQPAASALGLKVMSSDWLTRNAKLNDPVLGNPKVLDAAFSADVLQKKHNSEPVSVGNNTVAVVRVAEQRPEREQTLDEVKDQIRKELIQQEGSKLADARGKEWLAALQAGKALPEAHWQDLGDVSRRGASPLSPAEMRAIFSAPASKLPAYAGVKRENGDYALFTVTAVKQAQNVDDALRAQIQGLIGEVNGNAELTSYLELLREKYKVLVSRQAATAE